MSTLHTFVHLCALVFGVLNWKFWATLEGYFCKLKSLGLVCKEPEFRGPVLQISKSSPLELTIFLLADPELVDTSSLILTMSTATAVELSMARGRAVTKRISWWMASTKYHV